MALDHRTCLVFENMSVFFFFTGRQPVVLYHSSPPYVPLSLISLSFAALTLRSTKPTGPRAARLAKSGLGEATRDVGGWVGGGGCRLRCSLSHLNQERSAERREVDWSAPPFIPEHLLAFLLGGCFVP